MLAKISNLISFTFNAVVTSINSARVTGMEYMGIVSARWKEVKMMSEGTLAQFGESFRQNQ